ncbi:MAG: hypothetical protein WAQ57_00480 [Candidatus Saccharimonadales bacterium]
MSERRLDNDRLDNFMDQLDFVLDGKPLPEPAPAELAEPGNVTRESKIPDDLKLVSPYEVTARLVGQDMAARLGRVASGSVSVARIWEVRSDMPGPVCDAAAEAAANFCNDYGLKLDLLDRFTGQAAACLGSVKSATGSEAVLVYRFATAILNTTLRRDLARRAQMVGGLPHIELGGFIRARWHSLYALNPRSYKQARFDTPLPSYSHWYAGIPQPAAEDKEMIYDAPLKAVRASYEKYKKAAARADKP